MVETQPPESSRSLSPGPTPSDAGSSVQVHAEIGSSRTQSVTGTERSLTPSVRDPTRITVDHVRERLFRTRLSSPFVSSHGTEAPFRDDLLIDLIHPHDSPLFSTASAPISQSLKRPHDGEPTDTEPLAKRDRLIEELDQMVSAGRKAAIKSLQARQRETDENGDPVTSTGTENTIPKLEGHARVVLPIRSSTKRQANWQQSGYITALPEQNKDGEINSEQGTSGTPRLDDSLL
ncbi:hypothetical protein SMACR_12857 [Sordaria macrospora]|uniref:Uncharacterized protein n=1 Tax=Sordaria macrospora TaxID=5147 RepID=A0A8S8ZN97_SORMA|nr:hypothetical protein SMACR_12857 [Sordaria macrospora]WPJ62153.1 hypothetical protein SMAC4_12857 [Sordaria macrospora]